MKDFLKENIAIVAAIVLPVILVVVFALSTAITHVRVDDPQYSFFITSNYYNPENSSFAINVVDERLVVSYRAPQKDNNGNYIHSNVPRLWKVNIPSREVEEIALIAPADKRSADLTIPGVTDVRVRNIQPGPDGYTFVNYYRYGGGIMNEIFSADRRHNTAALEKDGRYYAIKLPGNENYYTASFTGWIIPDAP
jgi:hypothetical protein